MKLFFDTETTGVPLNYRAPVTDTNNWPRLVQIGWILQNDKGKTVHEEEAIILPDGFEIPVGASGIHGITTEIAKGRGSDLQTILNAFSFACVLADSIIGHNVKFDLNIVGAEFVRMGMTDAFAGKKIYDTMELSTNYCKIPSSRGYKWPKLSELYMKLFETDMGHAHTALADIQNTAKCFYKLQSLGVIQE
jgi:DNA polymerase III epsilon subunit-like protein